MGETKSDLVLMQRRWSKVNDIVAHWTVGDEVCQLMCSNDGGSKIL